MSDLHPLLQRQLQKLGLDATSLPTDEAAWAALLERLSRTYTQSEQDRYLLERSFSLASEEMQQEITERKRVEESLRQTHKELDAKNRQLERIHELLRTTVDHVMNLILRGASNDELMTDLRLVQREFERLDQPQIKGT